MELDVEYDFSIIGIKTILDDHALAYHLNKNIDTYFVRSEIDLDIQSKSGKELSYFSHFIYENEEEMEEWHLISNKYNTENIFSEEANESLQDLFSQNKQSTQITRYFIPEKKEINYILRIDSIENQMRVDDLVNRIRSISSITTAYSIEYNTLHSKRNLIF